jgi:hypothetical protein
MTLHKTKYLEYYKHNATPGRVYVLYNTNIRKTSKRMTQYSKNLIHFFTNNLTGISAIEDMKNTYNGTTNFYTFKERLIAHGKIIQVSLIVSNKYTSEHTVYPNLI